MQTNTSTMSSQDADINYIQQKLQRLKNPKNNWGLTIEMPKSAGIENSVTIRILPYVHAAEKNWSFIEAFFHFSFGKYGHLACPKYNQTGECKICDHVSELYHKADQIALEKGIDIRDKRGSGMGNVPEIRKIWDVAKAIKVKKRIYAPVIVRGKEEEGVKFFGFSPTMYDDILSYLGKRKRSPLDRYAGYDMMVTKKNDASDFGKTSFDFLYDEDPSPILKGSTNEEIDKFVDAVPNIWDVFLEQKSETEINEIYASLLDPITGYVDLGHGGESTGVIVGTKVQSVAQTEDAQSFEAKLKAALGAVPS